MPTWTFPVQLKLNHSPANAGEAQAIAARIEEVLGEKFASELENPRDAVICMQPVPGTHRHTSCDPEA